MLRFLKSKNRNPDPALELFREHTALVYGLCLRYLSTPERAEDASMEVYQILREKLPKHEVSNPKSWLHTLVRNHCLMQLRSEKKYPDFVQSEGLEHQAFEEQEETDTRPLHRCLKTLKEEQRRCVHLFYLTGGESYQTIAQKLNLSTGRVRSHLQNGRRNLKICLEKQVD